LNHSGTWTGGILILGAAVLVLLACTPALGSERFPQPEFESGYEIPVEDHPDPRAAFWVWVDSAALLAALSLGAFLVLRFRSRKALFLLMTASLVYFGFVREGCICAVGSLQNVALSLSLPSYTIPLGALVFFLLPLIFTLLFGRIFCGAACPLGAIQDAVLLRPIRVPRPLAAALGFFPAVYLGLAVLFASTGAGFIICRYDPFVGFFRRSASTPMLAFGASLLAVGVFVGRPYCRFLCPYGVLLGWFGRLSRKHASITPDRCVQCRLCEDACPFDAIVEPTEEMPHAGRSSRARALGFTLLGLPVIVFFLAWVGSLAAPAMARVHPTVDLADQVWREETGRASEVTEASDAFRGTGRPESDLLEEAGRIQDRFRFGGWLLGGFLGLVFGLKIAGLFVHTRRTDYEPDRGACVSCTRCFKNCPQEQRQRRKESDDRTE
jgi:polyferredoxin